MHDGNDRAGDYYAWAMHLNSNIDAWNFQLQHGQYNYDIDNIDRMAVGAYSFYDSIAAEATMTNANIAYSMPVAGDMGVLGGVIYTVVDLSTLNTMISNGDDVTKVVTSLITDMSFMFDGSSFNQDISSWDTSNVTTMDYMFGENTTFNQPIGAWNVSNVTNITQMFRLAGSFNQDLSNWDVTNVTDCIQFNSLTPQWTLPKPNLPNSCLD